jgi:hypothetical protein
MAFPTMQRHASARYGAAMELVQQEPFSIGVELATDGTYATTFVGGTTGAEAWPLGFVPEVFVAEDGMLDEVKNCPTPKMSTKKMTTARSILLVLFT